MTYVKKNKPVDTKPVDADTLSDVLTIPDPNERSAELAKLELTEAQKDLAQDAAKEDFLGDDVVEEDVPEVEKPNKRAQKLLDELEGKGVAVSYPSNFSKWDEATYQRLEKLNK